MDRDAPAVAASTPIGNRRAFERERYFAQVGPGVVRRPEDFTVASVSAVIVECKSHLRILHSNLERAVEVNIGDLYRYASNQETIEKIREGIKQGDFTRLTEFITHLHKVHFVPAETLFQEAEKAIEEVRSMSMELVTDCRIKAVEAKSQKAAALLVGGTIATGGLGVGLTLLIAAEVYKVEIFSTLVGLYLTAAIGVAAGLRMAYAAYRASSNYATSEKEFKELSQSLDEIVLSSSSILDLTCTIKENLDSLSRTIGIVSQAREAHQSTSSLVLEFDRLCQTICSLDASIYQNQLRAMNTDL